MKARLKLTDSQFKSLDTDTRRNMIYQLMFIDTQNISIALEQMVSGGNG